MDRALGRGSIRGFHDQQQGVGLDHVAGFHGDFGHLAVHGRLDGQLLVVLTALALLAVFMLAAIRFLSAATRWMNRKADVLDEPDRTEGERARRSLDS
jgi:hypothetical protein